MIKKITTSLIAFCLTVVAFAQDKYYTKTGKIEFFSSASMEDLEAKSKTAAAVLDSKSGTIQFSVLMRSFDFEKKLMQEHFNENYVESEKYPKAEFRGVIVNNSQVNYARPGNYPVKVKGKLTIHGVTRDVETNGTVEVNEGKVQVESVFNIKLSDYKVKIPSVVSEKVSNTIKITVNCKMEPLKA